MSTAKTTVAVTGATGQVGSATVRCLAQQFPDIRVRAGVRNKQKATMLQNLGPSVEVVQFDTAIPETLTKAFTGANVACIIPPNGPNRIDHTIAMMTAAKKCEVKHVVMVFGPVDRMPKGSLMLKEVAPAEVSDASISDVLFSL